MPRHEKHGPSVFVLLPLLAALVASSCSGALTDAERSKGKRDYTDAIYLFAEAVSEGQLEPYEFKAKLSDIKRALGKNAFCFHLDQAMKRAGDNIALYLKQGNTSQVEKETEKSHEMALVKKSSCQKGK
jgi:hypothetical protein